MNDVSGVRAGNVPVQAPGEDKFVYTVAFLKPNAVGHYRPGKGWRIHSVIDRFGHPEQSGGMTMLVLLERPS